MENYKILMEINRKEIFAEEISDIEKQKVVSALLSGISSHGDVISYKKGMGVNPDTDHMYPDYYIPPYHGNKKLRLIQGFLPKTNLLYANHYELEILRLLVIFAPENEKVREMAKNTRYRIENTCYGNSCPQGECVAAGISVLRFLAASWPEDTEWLDRLICPLGERFLSFGNGRAAMQNGVPFSYLLMAFTDIPNEKTRNYIAQKKEWLLALLRKGKVSGRVPNGKMAERDYYSLMEKYIVRNAISILREDKDISIS